MNRERSMPLYGSSSHNRCRLQLMTVNPIAIQGEEERKATVRNSADASPLLIRGSSTDSALGCVGIRCWGWTGAAFPPRKKAGSIAGTRPPLVLFGDSVACVYSWIFV